MFLNGKSIALLCSGTFLSGQVFHQSNHIFCDTNFARSQPFQIREVPLYSYKLFALYKFINY